MRLNYGFEINNILENEITKEKATKVFANLDEQSLEKVIRYCLGNTYYSCWGRDEYYYCTIIKFVNEEF